MASVLERPALEPQADTAREAITHVLLVLTCFALAIAAVVLRAWRLDRVPGINGDEAWYGVQAQQLLTGGELTWHTPTGNPLNPFFFGPEILAHTGGAPSSLRLRLPALLSGLAVLGVNYWCCRRLFGTPAAAISTLFLAVVPVGIVYSRLAWDTSQSLLASVLVIYTALGAVAAPRDRKGKWYLATIAASCFAVVVHPTNVFVLPIAMVAVVHCAFFDFNCQSGIGRAVFRPHSRRVVLAVLVSAAVAAPIFIWLMKPWAGPAIHRLMAPAEYFQFIANFVHLVSGVTVLQYVAGSVGLQGTDSHTLIYDLPVAAALLFTGWGLYQQIRTQELALDRCLATGWAIGLAAFFLFAGPQAMAPHWERYGLWLIAPTALMVARGANWWTSRSELRGAFVPAVMLLGGWLWVAAFYSDFFVFFERMGGQSHVTFSTGNDEPKLDALNYVLSRSDTNSPIEIVAADWWTYWPLKYLSAAHPHVSVRSLDEALATPRVVGTPAPWIVVFDEDPQRAEKLHSISPNHALTPQRVVTRPDGRPLLDVFGPLQ